MPDTVTIGGKQVSKKALYGAGAVAAVFVGYMYIRRRNEAPTTGATVDDLGVTEYTPPNQIPTTQDATVNVDSAGLSEIPTTNAQWSTLAVQRLSDIGFEPLAVALAVGLYLARQPMSQTQVDMIRTAVGLIGPPPLGGPYPLTATSTPTTAPTPTSGGGSTATKTTVWQGHKVTAADAAITFRQFAAKFARIPSNPDSVTSTALAIKARNPTTLLGIGSSSHLKAGWNILVPITK